MRPVRPLLAAVAALAAAAAGCDATQHDNGYAVPGRTLTVYSGLPLRGLDRPEALDLADAERLALAQAGGRAGRWRVRLRVLDDSGPGARRWNPARVSQNARLAGRDPTTIAFLGGSSSGATAVALPLLNQAGILQVSPLAGAVALTRPDPALPGSPQKFYPNERAGRTFGRVVPPDSVEAAMLARWMAASGVRSIYLVATQEAEAASLAAALQRELTKAHVAVAGSQSVTPGRADWGSVATAARRSGAGALFFAGSAQAGAPAMFAAVRAAAPGMAVYGSDQLAQPAVAEHLGPGGEDVRLPSPALPVQALPPAGARFRKAFRRAYGREPEPAAVFGYEAMRVVLDAVRRAGADGNRRAAVVKKFFATERPRSPLGAYAVDRLGDSTLRSYAGYQVRDGRLVAIHVARAGDRMLTSP